MKYVSVFITLYFAMYSVFARAADVTYMLVGTPAPYTGFLLSPAKADKVHDLDVELKSKQKINLLMQAEQDLYVKRLQNSQSESEHLAKQLESERDKSFFGKAGYFVLGALLTGGIAYGVARSMK